MSGCGFQYDDGAYVLGALGPEDRVAFESHLVSCDACARSVRELAGLPGLLSRVPAGSLDPDAAPVPVPDTLLPALVRHARAHRRRRTWISAGLVAAVTVTALSAGFALGRDVRPVTASQPPTTVTAPRMRFTPVGGTPISGWVSLTQVGWGTRLDLTCSYGDRKDQAGQAGKSAYGDNVYRPVHGYTMVITRLDGSTEDVATWTASPDRTVRLTAATASPRADITRVVVRTSDGREVLHLDPLKG